MYFLKVTLADPRGVTVLMRKKTPIFLPRWRFICTTCAIFTPLSLLI
jgi:hypothetical protein